MKSLKNSKNPHTHTHTTFMTEEDNTPKTKLTRLTNNFRPARLKKYEAKKEEIKNLQAELAQKQNQPASQIQKSPLTPKRVLSKVFRTVRKSTYDRKKTEI